MKKFIKFSYFCGFLVLSIMVYMGKNYIFPKKYSELVTISGRVVSANLNGGIEIETEQNNRIRLFCDDVSMNLATSQRVRTNGDYGSCKWVLKDIIGVKIKLYVLLVLVMLLKIPILKF